MKILLFSLLLMGIIIPVYADSFEGVDNGNFVLLEINDEKATANMRIDGKLNSISGDIKYYDEGAFKLKSDSNARILLFATPISDESLKIIIIDLTERKKTVIEVQKLRTHVLQEVEAEFTPLIIQEEPEKIVEEKIIIPRSEYTEDKDRKIAILDQTPRTVSAYSFFDFDIRIVDADKNNLYSYYNTDGYIDGVEIVSVIKDGDGNALNKFIGNTTKKGHYAPDAVTYFEDNINTRKAFSLEVLATAYFADTETYSTVNLFKEFFVYVPSGSKPVCDPGYIFNSTFEICMVE